MALTFKQKIAQKEQEVANLKAQARKQETSQKIIIGGMMLALAKNDDVRAQMLIDDIKNNVTRDSDIKKLSSVIDELSVSDDVQKNTATDTDNNLTHNDDH